jgi:hypothetical protein
VRRSAIGATWRGAGSPSSDTSNARIERAGDVQRGVGHEEERLVTCGASSRRAVRIGRSLKNWRRLKHLALPGLRPRWLRIAIISPSL